MHEFFAKGDSGQEHVDFLNKHVDVQFAVVDTSIDLFVIDEDAEGYSTGRANGWDLTQNAGRVKF